MIERHVPDGNYLLPSGGIVRRRAEFVDIDDSEEEEWDGQTC